MKKKNEPTEPEHVSVDTLVVGAGPAGLTAARKLQLRYPEAQVMVLDSDERAGGRAGTGLHLLPNANLEQYPMISTRELKPARVRWERQWIDASDVDWNHKDWIAIVPQWSLYLRSYNSLYLGMKASEVEVPVRYRTPVSRLTPESDETLDSKWQLETPDKIYHAKRVIWAAGFKAFQNAFGKIQTQSLLVANPKFNAEAEDYRGGIALDFDFQNPPVFEEGFPFEGVFALPVRHNGLLYLMFGALAEDGKLIKTLTHVSNDLLIDPKEMLSFQKALRRSIKGLLMKEESFQERWVVNPLVGGHVLGSRGIFGLTYQGHLDFVGDSCIGALCNGQMDILGALDSVTQLADLADVPIEENYSKSAVSSQLAAQLL